MVLGDAGGILMVNCLQNGETINGTYYASLLRQLRENIKVKRQGKLNKGMLFHQDNALSHKSVITTAAINDCGFELIQHPPPHPHTPYSPDLAPSDFHLFPEFKKAISGTHIFSSQI